MYKQKNKMYHAGVLVIALLLSTHTMAEEIQQSDKSQALPQGIPAEMLIQDTSALTGMTSDWQQDVRESLQRQLRLPAKPLVLAKTVVLPEANEMTWSVGVREIEPPRQLLVIDAPVPTAPCLTLQGPQLLENTSQQMKQLDG